MVVAACVKVFLAHGRLKTHKQSNCWRRTYLASAPGHQRGKTTSPGRHQDNGRCVQSALTPRTLRDTPPAPKTLWAVGGGGRPRPFALSAGLRDTVHASCSCQRGLSSPLFYCRRPLSLTRALSLSLNLRSCVTFSWISQHHEKKKNLSPTCPDFALTRHRTASNECKKHGGPLTFFFLDSVYMKAEF